VGRGCPAGGGGGGGGGGGRGGGASLGAGAGTGITYWERGVSEDLVEVETKGSWLGSSARSTALRGIFSPTLGRECAGACSPIPLLQIELGGTQKFTHACIRGAEETFLTS